MSNSNEAPYAGKGLHEWILEHTRREILRGKNAKDVAESTFRLARNKGRPREILSREIADAVAGAVKWLAAHPDAKALSGPNDLRPRRGWEYRDRSTDLSKVSMSAKHWKTDLDRKLIDGIVNRRRLERLRPREALDIAELFGRCNFKICIAKEINNPNVKTLNYWRERPKRLANMQWIVPNPFLKCGEGGGIKTLANAAERIWLIIEFDSMSLEEQSKLLLWLGATQVGWDLAMIVYSGGKSLHGWYSCVGKSEYKETVQFFRLATSLGCDRMMRTSVQYTRLPLGINAKTKQPQSIWHWNEDAIVIHNQKLKERYNEER